ncbi:beta-lactamase-like protein [Syncephalis fuscata]|nr:beta-lactamase-like protein [Syncephalis fuscata]
MLLESQMLSAADKPCLVEVIFLGTGTSGCLPNVTCLSIEERPGCRACKVAMTHAGRKNRRRNTSIVARWQRPDGSLFNLLVDCGKTFYTSALDCFPRYRINKIDAVLLTHGHADAIFGLDDLRSFSAVQGTNIPIYATAKTLEVVHAAFPYLVDRRKATGGGNVAALEFRTFNENKPLVLERNIEITPLPVHHGYDADGEIFYNVGVLMDQFAYIADVNYIPATTRSHLSNLEVIVLDALQLTPFISHFSYQQAIDECFSIKAKRSFLIDFTHMLEHDAMVKELTDLESENDIHIRPTYDGMRLRRTLVPNAKLDQYDWIDTSIEPAMI